LLLDIVWKRTKSS